VSRCSWSCACSWPHSGAACSGAVCAWAVRGAWQKGRADLETEKTARARGVAAAELRETLWSLDAGVCSAAVHLPEKYLGLARGEVAAPKVLAARLSAGLAGERRTEFARLKSLRVEIERGTGALGPAATITALRARDSLGQLLAEGRTSSQWPHLSSSR
jgi:hypothetical protein